MTDRIPDSPSMRDDPQRHDSTPSAIKHHRRPWRFTAISAASLLAVGALFFIDKNYEAPQALAANVAESALQQTFNYPLVFEEPFSPIGVATEDEEAQLRRAISIYIDGQDSEDLTPFLKLIESNPNNPWTASIWLNLGLQYRRTGYYSRALSAFETSWELARADETQSGHMIADRAVGEWARLSGSLGRYEILEPLLEEIKERDVSGTATARLEGASQGLWLMDNEPERAFRCGPMALGNIAHAMGFEIDEEQLIADMPSTRQGTSLLENYELSREIGMNMQMAFRTPGAEVITPAVVHWRSGHFAALTREINSVNQAHPIRYVSKDPTFRDTVDLSLQALDDEASGYFLIPKGELPEGWKAVDEDEASSVWGRGNTTSSDDENTTSNDDKSSENCGSAGMAQYSAHLALVSLNIVDIPLYHKSPRGPDVSFRVTYNQREAYQPTIFPHSNLGAKWSLDYVTYIEDEQASIATDVYLVAAGGGRETYYSDSTDHGFVHHYRSQGSLERISSFPNAIKYQRELPDGTIETYAESFGSSPRRVYLSQITDPAGNDLDLHWSTVNTGVGQKLRLDSLSDALGRSTSLQYTDTQNPLRITSVTSLGRTASFAYTNNKLTQITDMAGLDSTFTYSGDFITSLTNDDGTTTFATGIIDNNPIARWLEATDPLGETERFEYRSATGLTCPVSNTDSDLLCRYDYYGPPAGVTQDDDGHLDHRNTFHWNKAAWAEAQSLSGQDKFKLASIYHWLHTDSLDVASGVLGSTKQPNENRMWYVYSNNQADYRYYEEAEGTYLIGGNGNPSAQADITAQYVDEGVTTSIRKVEQNIYGHPLKITDPSGRVTEFEYDSNNIDLISIKQKVGTSLYDTLHAWTYTTPHLPATYTDTAGQTTTYGWSSTGLLETVTNPLSEVVTYTYDIAGDGYLQTITGDAIHQPWSFTYDSFDRVETVTDGSGYVLDYDYDDLNRLTTTTYPDGSTQLTSYIDGSSALRFRPQSQTDRTGKTTSYTWDGVGRLTTVTDPEARVTTYDWCGCGSLAKIIDPGNNATTFLRDVIGRLETKRFADNSETNFTYDRAGRPDVITDSEGQERHFTFNVDGTLDTLDYQNENITTASVSYTWGSYYRRPATMVDGTGTTNYTYIPVINNATYGDGQLLTVNGPLTGDTITYGYDKLGRVETRQVGTETSTWVYDNLGRIDSVATAIGTFDPSYVSNSPRVDYLSYPNGQVTDYDYFDAAGDFRLKQILNEDDVSAIISDFTYTHSDDNTLDTWYQSPTGETWDFTHDGSGFMTEVADASNSQTLYEYDYDDAGNREKETITGGTTTCADHNSINQLDALDAACTGTAQTLTYDDNGNFDQKARRSRGDRRERVRVNLTGMRKTDWSKSPRAPLKLNSPMMV